MLKKVLTISIIIAFIATLGLTDAGCKTTATTTTSAESTKAAETTTTAAAETTTAAKKYEIVVVDKIEGIPWFVATAAGIKKASEELGVNAYQVGPAQADPAQQVKVIEDMINKGVDAILTWPNDSQSVEPAFKKAKERGILTMTMENPQQKEVTWNVEPIDTTVWMQTLADEVVARMGTDVGEYVIFTGGATVASHNAWADILEKYISEKYPNLKEATKRFPTEESQITAHDKTLEYINTYPNLTAIFGIGSINGPGAAQAVREKGLQGKIHVAGMSLPSDSKQYLEDGSMDISVLYNVVDTAKGWIYVAKLTLDGEKITDGMSIPGLGNVKVEGQNITSSLVLKITKDNVDQIIKDLGF
ncbi:MAG: substrate-binding domain-containing protein [Actinobacteria bacterium]|nr:substrate-binding domain-containing protein [Cyanobacteriota bacterium]MCL5771116.1 substrate-binding domain-containing protein [Actinomycetota bacterium]